ncbi:helix-turn-helix domain-containing protein [Agathobacter sp.]|mgnify:FL=1|jgi:transcriptional regulator with XRE-family HTH domain|uniref:helix-turn-helix domain-containing protein n=1 Tax=Agathobacter sp. TaxID=2021311 RepID=UPI0027D9B79C|nr:helix-turn-helix domain-containing protein [Agathobacter sp.]
MNYPVLDLKATGERINQLRKDNNLRVTDVAEYMGFESTQAVYKWQRGESLPTVDNLYALSRLLHTSVDDILIGEKERDDEPSLSFSFYIFFGFLVLLNVHFISSISSSVAEIDVSLTITERQ